MKKYIYMYNDTIKPYQLCHYKFSFQKNVNGLKLSMQSTTAKIVNAPTLMQGVIYKSTVVMGKRPS